MEDKIIEQKKFFATMETQSYSFRMAQLTKLYDAIVANQAEISQALYSDLHKSEAEAYLTEIGYTLNVISHTKKHLKKWMKNKRTKPSLLAFSSKHQILNVPYGVVLIIAPFNYPFQLALTPLIAAISAGNCAIVKVSEMAQNTADIIKKIIGESFNSQYIEVVTGDKMVTSALLSLDFDYFFFTGSSTVGKIVMKAASDQLIPVTLELGGKSPVIVDATANIEQAAYQIVWAKMINAGQTCIAPDYILVEESVKQSLIEHLISAKEHLYGVAENESLDFSRIINQTHSIRLEKMIIADRDNIIYGGQVDIEEKFISFTLVDVKNQQAACMQEEIFGPILGIISYQNKNEIIEWVEKHPTPLALYAYTNNRDMVHMINQRLSFGGGSINTIFSHITAHDLPFGGVKNSGIGKYHGIYGFYTFTNQKAMVYAKAKKPQMLMFPPYETKLKWVKRFFK